MAKVNSINNKSSELTLDPGASGDSYIQFDINTSNKFRMGVDDDDSDKFKISASGSLGTTDAFEMTSSGERTMPLQPAFLVFLTSDDSNVTGDDTTYSVATWDSEVFDRGGNFSGSTFTAPITGQYRFECSLLLGGLTSSHSNMSFFIVTSNRSYSIQGGPGSCKSSDDTFSVYCTALADMDAGDTAEISVNVKGGSKVVDILSDGATNPVSWFSGNLEV